MGKKIQTELTYYITGPTACGKTKTAIELAKLIGGEVVSADSTQIYKHMNIGSAKPTEEEMQGIRHHLIDELDPNEEYSAALFQRMARAAISDIKKRGKTPIITGGSGFYLNALLYDTSFYPKKTDKNDREKYMQIAEQYGNISLHGILRERDSESADAIHPNNVKRVIRALLYYDETGIKMSSHNAQEAKKKMPQDARLFILNMSRPILYQRINQRVDEMFKEGLVEEVQRLVEMGCHEQLTSMQALGYKETLSYLRNHSTLDEAMEKIKRSTRNFAKRQITWFKHKCNGVWLDMDSIQIRDLIEMAKTSNIWK